VAGSSAAKDVSIVVAYDELQELQSLDPYLLASLDGSIFDPDDDTDVIITVTNPTSLIQFSRRASMPPAISHLRRVLRAVCFVLRAEPYPCACGVLQAWHEIYNCFFFFVIYVVLFIR
jgi:hypothetical protein